MSDAGAAGDNAFDPDAVRQLATVRRRTRIALAAAGVAAVPSFFLLPLHNTFAGWPFVTCIAVLVVAVGSLRRIKHQATYLSKSRWMRVQSQYAVGLDPFVLLGWPDLNPPPVFRLRWYSKWRPTTSGVRDASELDVAGDPASYVVIRVPGRKVLLSARPPRTERARTRYRRIAERPSVAPLEGQRRAGLRRDLI